MVLAEHLAPRREHFTVNGLGVGPPPLVHAQFRQGVQGRERLRVRRAQRRAIGVHRPLDVLGRGSQISQASKAVANGLAKPALDQGLVREIGGDLSGGVWRRAETVRAWLVPLLVSAVHRSGQLAMAVEMRHIRERLVRTIEAPKLRVADAILALAAGAVVVAASL